MSAVSNPGGTGGRVSAINGVRALAILGVVLFHLFGISGVVTAGGDSLHERLIWTLFGNTLDFFFIVSGFGLFLPVVRRGGRIPPTGRFYLKRFARLQPEYWACLLILISMIAVFGTAPVPSPGDIAIHFLDLQKVAQFVDPEILVGFWIWGGAIWMVPVIAGLYLLFPLLARIFRRSVLAGLLLTAAVTLGWKLGITHFPGILQAISGQDAGNNNLQLIAADQTPAYLYSFGLGMTAAWIYHQARLNPDSPWISRGVILAFAVGIPAFLLCSIPYTAVALDSLNGIDGSSRGRSLAFNGLASSTIRTTLFLGLILGPMWLQRPFSSRPAEWFADQSFGVYLIHLPVAFLAMRFFSPPMNGTFLDLALWCVLVIPAATAYGWCSRRWIGLPSAGAADRWIKRRSGPS